MLIVGLPRRVRNDDCICRFKIDGECSLQFDRLGDLFFDCGSLVVFLSDDCRDRRPDKAAAVSFKVIRIAELLRGRRFVR